MHTCSQHDKYIAVGLPKKEKKHIQCYGTAKNTNKLWITREITAESKVCENTVCLDLLIMR